MRGEEANEVEYLYTREFDEIRDALIGETDADNYRHGIVRSAFLQEFWRDGQVQALVSRWAKETGLERCAVRLANAGEQIVELAGLAARGEVPFQDEFSVEEDKVYAFEAASSEWVSAYEDLMLKIDEPGHAELLAQEAEDFVRGLGLPYPWLVLDLADSTIHAILGLALGRVYHQNLWYQPEPISEIPAPMATLSFQTREGESVEQALERLLGEVEKTAKKLAEPVPPTGRVPERTIPVLERNARWFYRHRVKRESIRSISMSDFSSSDRRKDVYDGIKRAEALLNLTQFTF